MLTMALNMHTQFRTSMHLVPITDNSMGTRFFKYSLIGWGLPALLLGASMLVQYHDKGGKLLDTASLKEQNCWFLDRNAFIYGLLVPSALVLATTLYYLTRAALIARFIINMQVDRRIRDKMRRKRTLQIALFTKITILLGIVLALGALSKLVKSDAVWIAYHIGQGAQGFFIAIFVTCNCQVLKLYTKSMKSRASRHIPTYGNMARSSAAVSKSTSLQLLTWEPAPDPV